MFDLDRFKKAQENDYSIALSEIKNGEKQSHWIWYIFPQLKELGFSPTAKFYGIENIQEAKKYLEDELLKNRLIEISNALLKLDSCNATEVMGYPDDLKLKSCMTLFNAVNPKVEVFSKVLEKYFGGEKDEKTLELIKHYEN